MAASISVWIVNYNSANHLAQCLVGLTSTVITSIVVLDNASESADWAAVQALAATDPRVQAIRSQVNLGFGGGHQRIAEHVRLRQDPDDLIWVLNPDTRVEPDVPASLAQVLQSGAADIVVPLILTGRRDEPRIWFAGGEIDRRRGQVHPVNVGDPPAAVPRCATIPTAFVTGAALMLTRATWDELGGLRTDLFLYWEDVDLSLRAIDAGLRLAVAGLVSLWHLEGGSSGSGTSATAYYYSARNRITVCTPYGSRLGLVFGRGAGYVVRHAARALVKGGPGRLGRLVAVLDGSLAGLRGRTGQRRLGRGSRAESDRSHR
jgi:N-acetylglucosaminyl-diphospho-decaprenol L-rhamnosyltransferase